METVISNKSAVEYWRIHGKAQIDRQNRHRRKAPPAISPDAATIRQLNNKGLSYPIHVLVSTADIRRRSKKLKPHVCTHPLPEGSIIEVGEGLFVCSPELAFFQMASDLKFAKLLELGLELCGTYTLPVKGVHSEDPEVAKKQLYNRTQLTSKERLAAFLARTEGQFGQRRFSRTLQFMADNSASPRETQLFLLLTLPYKYGGYGFFQPELNAKITPTKAAKETSSKKFFRCDLFWPEHNVAVEYESDLIHLTPLRIAYDSMKRNSLIAMGITVITVTNKQISSAEDFDRVAKQLAVNLNRRLRSNESDGFLKARCELRSLL